MPFTTSKTKPKQNNFGKRSIRQPISEKAAKTEAIRLLRNDALSPLATRTLDALTTAGILTRAQLKHLTSVSNRSLNRYHKQHLIDTLIAPDTLTAYGLAHSSRRLRLYTLGMVGLAVAEQKERLAATYIGYGTHQITHDVLCNTVVLSLIKTGAAAGYRCDWYGKYEARVYGMDGNLKACILEPDALLIFTKEGEPPRPFIIEYHNETHQNRVLEKVEKYEREARNQQWRDTWPLDHFPTVLAAFTHKAVATGYNDALRRVRGRGLRCRYLGQQFALNKDDPAAWWDFNGRETINIFSSDYEV